MFILVIALVHHQQSVQGRIPNVFLIGERYHGPLAESSAEDGITRRQQCPRKFTIGARQKVKLRHCKVTGRLLVSGHLNPFVVVQLAPRGAQCFTAVRYHSFSQWGSSK
jgi:hypothetical protein